MCVVIKVALMKVMLSIGIKFSLFLDIKLYILEITEFSPSNSKNSRSYPFKLTEHNNYMSQL